MGYLVITSKRELHAEKKATDDFHRIHLHAIFDNI